MVRVLGGRAAWELPPGEVGPDELQVRSVVLGGEAFCFASCLYRVLVLFRCVDFATAFDGGGLPATVP